MTDAIKVENLTKNFGKKVVIKDLSFTIKNQEFVAIVGPSGCGKSTLLNILGLLEDFSSGSVELFGQALPSLNSKKATIFRRNMINYLFQSFALISNKTVKENLYLATYFKKFNKNKRDELIDQVLTDLDILHTKNDQVAILSGGEKQRIALARTILKPGNLILADEPTGALDEKHAKQALNYIIELRDKYQKTVVMVTHNLEHAHQADRIIYLTKDNFIF